MRVGNHFLVGRFGFVLLVLGFVLVVEESLLQVDADAYADAYADVGLGFCTNAEHCNTSVSVSASAHKGNDRQKDFILVINHRTILETLKIV
jgi:hypothetical protein